VAYSFCPAAQVSGSSLQLIFTTAMKVVTKDRLSDCNKSVTYISMEGLGIEELSENAFGDFYYLEVLKLANNSISILPPHLLDHKRGLVLFTVNNNQLEKIEDGTFKHLDNIRSINLQFNNITYVGPNVFAENLKFLEFVNLSNNSLTYFEPWPFIPKTNPDDGIDVVFDLRNNSISEFRNSII
jgi:Leucine-rich repeat (LRR) protein